MEIKPLSPTNDFVFKKVFGENLTVLEDFLKAVLDLPAEEYQGLTVVDPNLDREFVEDKLGVLDIKVTTKSGQVIADETHLGNWMRFFRATTEEDFMTVAQTNPAINEAWGVIKVLSGDERARALAEAREKARMDLDSWLGDARYEGRQEGLQEGRQEEKLEIARNLLRTAMSHNDIVTATGLPLEDVKRLAAELS